MREHFSRMRHHAGYTRHELIAMAIVATVAGFSLSFAKWGYVTFNAAVGLQNLITYSIYAFLALLCIDIARKYYAISIGYRSEFKVWHIGILLAIMVSFVSKGSLHLLLLSGFLMHRIDHLQYGRPKTGFNIRDPAKIAFWGLMGGLLLAVCLSLLATQLPHLKQAIVVNLLIVVFSSIPVDILVRRFDRTIPLTNGTALLAGSRPLAVFAGLLLLLGYLSIFLVGYLWFLFVVIIIAALGTFYYIYTKEL